MHGHMNVRCLGNVFVLSISVRKTMSAVFNIRTRNNFKFALRKIKRNSITDDLIINAEPRYFDRVSFYLISAYI